MVQNRTLYKNRTLISEVYFSKQTDKKFREMNVNMMVRFLVEGDPRGKQRPKFASRGGFAKAYTPKETREYERKVRASYQRDCDDLKLEGPIEARIYANFGIPKSISKKKRKEMIGTYHMSKPDCDNIEKIILDPINEVAYDDDKQVCKLLAEKKYSEVPCIIVELEELNKKPSKEVICPIHFVDENGNMIDELFRRNI